METLPIPIFAPKAEFIKGLDTIQTISKTQHLQISQVKTQHANTDILKTCPTNGLEGSTKGPVLITTLKVETIEEESPAQSANTEGQPQPKTSPLDTLVHQIEETAAFQEKQLHHKAQHMVEMVGTLSSLTASFVRVFSMAAMACPHCISAVTPLFSSGMLGGLGGLPRGHWHKDGSFHADGEGNYSENQNGFWLDWMKVA